MNKIEIPFPELNSSIFSLNSIEGILLVVGIFFIIFFTIKYSTKKIVNLIFRLLGVLLIFQILYIIGTTSIDQYVHLSYIFKYDIFSAIAQFFPGTWLAKALTTAGHWLSQGMADIVNWIWSIPSMFGI